MLVSAFTKALRSAIERPVGRSRVRSSWSSWWLGAMIDMVMRGLEAGYESVALR